MSLGFGIYLARGAGTKSTITAATSISHTVNANSQQKDLQIAVIYVVYSSAPSNPYHFSDGGKPWVILAHRYDASALTALFMLGMVQQERGGVVTSFGISSDVNAAATCQSYCFSCPGPASGIQGAEFQYQLPLVKDQGCTIFTAASGTTVYAPASNVHYPQGPDIIAVGYNNAGTTTTCGTFAAGVYGSFTERFDTGQTSPPHGVVLDQRILYGRNSLPAISATLAAAKTNVMSARVFVPIIGNVMNGSRRYMSNRRLF